MMVSIAVDDGVARVGDNAPYQIRSHGRRRRGEERVSADKKVEAAIAVLKFALVVWGAFSIMLA